MSGDLCRILVALTAVVAALQCANAKEFSDQDVLANIMNVSPGGRPPQHGDPCFHFYVARNMSALLSAATKMLPRVHGIRERAWLLAFVHRVRALGAHLRAHPRAGDYQECLGGGDRTEIYFEEPILLHHAKKSGNSSPMRGRVSGMSQILTQKSDDDVIDNEPSTQQVDGSRSDNEPSTQQLYRSGTDEQSSAQQLHRSGTDNEPLTQQVDGSRMDNEPSTQQFDSSRMDNEPLTQQIDGGRNNNNEPSTMQVDRSDNDNEPSTKQVDGSRMDNEPMIHQIDGSKMKNVPSTLQVDRSDTDNEPSTQQVDGSRTDNEPSTQQFDGSRVDNEPSTQQFDGSRMDNEPSTQQPNMSMDDSQSSSRDSDRSKSGSQSSTRSTTQTVMHEAQSPLTLTTSPEGGSTKTRKRYRFSSGGHPPAEANGLPESWPNGEEDDSLVKEVNTGYRLVAAGRTPPTDALVLSPEGYSLYMRDHGQKETLQSILEDITLQVKKLRELGGTEADILKIWKLSESEDENTLGNDVLKRNHVPGHRDDDEYQDEFDDGALGAAAGELVAEDRYPPRDRTVAPSLGEVLDSKDQAAPSGNGQEDELFQDADEDVLVKQLEEERYYPASETTSSLSGPKKLPTSTDSILVFD